MSALVVEMGDAAGALPGKGPRRLLVIGSLVAAILAPWLLIVLAWRGLPEAAACFLGAPPA
jgi:hypothetical protein